MDIKAPALETNIDQRQAAFKIVFTNIRLADTVAVLNVCMFMLRLVSDLSGERM